uniref:Uncharacterized protein n=1 Tax=Bracon brevicornis TaxID=1563983 RepID=A0A6V7J7I3_9HYME
MQPPVPAPRHSTKSSVKKELSLDLDIGNKRDNQQSPKSKIPQALPSPLKSVTSTIPLDINLSNSGQKSKIPVKVKRSKNEDDGILVETTESKIQEDDTTIINKKTITTEKLEGDNGESTVCTKTVTTIVTETSVPFKHSDVDKSLENRNLIVDAAETSIKAMKTERIPSLDDNGACGIAKDIVRSISTKSSWESSSRSNDKDNWDQVQCSLDTSPSSIDVGFTRNGDSRHELPSDSDSDGSPRAQRRSLSKRRTLGSSSGSDVALHEGAELSPLEDDQGTTITAKNSK